MALTLKGKIMYKPDHFIIQEYISPGLFEELALKGRLSSAWELFDERLLRLDDQLRNRFGPITINNWHIGGNRHWSGLRTPDSPYYSKTSQHSFGRASDKKFADVEEEYVQEYILANPNEFPLLNSLELGVSWVHSDVRNCERIKTYRP